LILSRLLPTDCNLRGGTISAREGAVHSPGVRAIGRFSGKEERILHRRRKHIYCISGSRHGVAVCSARERISLPIMQMRSL
jgi:hypothetical protein